MMKCFQQYLRQNLDKFRFYGDLLLSLLKLPSQNWYRHSSHDMALYNFTCTPSISGRLWKQ